MTRTKRSGSRLAGRLESGRQKEAHVSLSDCVELTATRIASFTQDSKRLALCSFFHSGAGILMYLQPNAAAGHKASAGSVGLGAASRPFARQTCLRFLILRSAASVRLLIIRTWSFAASCDGRASVTQALPSLHSASFSFFHAPSAVTPAQKTTLCPQANGCSDTSRHQLTFDVTRVRFNAVWSKVLLKTCITGIISRRTSPLMLFRSRVTFL